MCGIFGIYNHEEAAKLTYLGLYALQHRGQESSGIATSDGSSLRSHVDMGLVADVFNQDNLSALKGDSAVGHVRYSTTGISSIKNAQPLVINYARGQIALAHNGNLINAPEWRAKLEKEGSIFQTSSDSEVILHLIAKANGKGSIEETVKIALENLKGAYSLVILTPGKLIACRDPWGIRPLCLGKLDNGWVAASESCALDLINAQYVREINPGEILVIDKNGMRSLSVDYKAEEQSMCIFEYIYFSRPDSMVFNKSVYSVRRELGRLLAAESMKKIGKADIVISVPDSANTAAIGFSQASGLPYETGLIRNHYIGRTFIEPNQHIRDFGAKIKYNPVRDVLNNKSVVVVDDSIVRGTTSKKLVKMIRDAGAREVHLVISAPPITSSCFYGIDTPTKEELIAANHSTEEIRGYLGVDTLHYLSLEGLCASTGCPSAGFCTACFTGKYKVKI
ncbi:MAG: amidophosphoribosyltransferase [Elusimicrobia bacterium RIFOXYA2_FULL_50_26]|nr:MAG: amidophosphoribosyltransferase [Elusimicrobia bacterium RIFOXYA2_FULL_50_26]OGS25292.1 MAG: amidophosphoribosyltransferase [Elusimicrobia bacterium RIFOXYB2_FULL_50_12]